MAVRQPKAPNKKPEPEAEEVSSLEEEHMEQEYHTEPSEDEAADEPQGEEEEFHTDPEDASPEPSQTDIPLLPTALLKSKPSTPGVRIDWEKMSRKERKALRDELGVSMKDLRGEAQRNGVIEAGRMAQIKRGIRPAAKVAGGRIAKRKRRGAGGAGKPAMSGRQKLVEQRGKEARKRSARGGEQKVSKKRKG